MNLATELIEAWRISWGAIRGHKLRSALTMLGVIIGVVTVTLMAAAISGLNQAFRESISQIGPDVLYVQKFPWVSHDEWWRMRNRRDILLADARRVAREATLARAVSFEAGRSRTVTYGSRTARNVFTIGNNEESALVRGLIISEGRFLSAADVEGARPVCVLGHDLAATLFPSGSPLGRKVRVDDSTFEVIGVIEKMGQFLFGNLDNQIIVPITRFVTDIARHPDVTLAVKVNDIRRMDEAEEELRGIMRRIRRVPPADPDDFAINEQGMILSAFNRVGGTIASVGLFITGLSLFVGGIGIMNIMFVSVAERTREIGIRKAVGARRRTILIQFLMEATLLCLIGGVAALGIAYPLTLLIGNVLPAALSGPVVALALLVSILTGLAAGVAPAYRASLMNPVDALRNE